MRILYAGQLSPRDSAEYRLWALRRLGYEVEALSSLDYVASNPLVRKIEFRVVAGPNVDRLNRDLLHHVDIFKPDVVWADKLLSMKPSTLRTLRKKGILSVSYMIDNFFGPRRDPGWRLYAKSIPLYDLHVTQRDVSVRDYLAHGARNVLKVQTAYEPTIHFPPPDGWSDVNRDRGVSFLGTPYDDRAMTLTRLAEQEGLPVTISGNPRQWQAALSATAFANLYREGELFLEKYREAIWRSRINLSFLTHSNQDEFVHKSFEIAACGGFLLAERSQGHLDRFVEDQEAVFFTGYDELAQKIKYYLDREPERARIAAAGQRRAQASGYDNDTQVQRILERLQTLKANPTEAA